MIIIIATEGKAANTEINFFKGLSHHLRLAFLKIYAFEKTRKSNSKEKEIKEEFKHIVGENFQKLQDEKAKLFFIGDGDAKKDIPAMNNTKNFIVKYIEEKWKHIITFEKKILMHNGYSFEKSYKKMSEKDQFPSNQKKASNKQLFNNCAEEFQWFTDSELDFLKIKKSMIKTQNPHLIIIEEIILQERP